MNRFHGIVATRAGALVAGALAAGAMAAGTMLAGATSSAGAVPAKLTPGTDPCTVLTQADLAGLSTSYTISSSVSELEHNCTFSLEHDGSTTPLQVSVESSIGYSAQKAVTKKQKKISGLPGGYTGQVNGGNEAAYKSGKAGVLLQDDDLSTADLTKILVSIHRRLG